MARPSVSVLIVTWNCRTLVGACLDHLFASRIDRPLEVILVDNASADDTAALVRARPEPVTVIDAPGNLGFGRGNNLAAEHARGDYLLLLNPDAYLTDPDALERLCRVLDADADADANGAGAVAAVAPSLVNPDGSHQVGDGGWAPTLGNVTRHQWLVSRFVPGVRGFHVNRPALLRRDRLALDWLAATCLLVRRAAFEGVGGFDPAFFMYGEDVDLGLRLGRAGGTQLMLPGVRVLHLQGATQRQDPNAIHVSFGWIDAIFALHRGGGAAAGARRRFLAASMAAGFAARSAAYRLRGGAGRARAAAMARYARHSWGLRRA